MMMMMMMVVYTMMIMMMMTTDDKGARYDDRAIYVLSAMSHHVLDRITYRS